ncbi:hypothetical protein FQZ97_747320 [compost metagenome]
MQLTTGTPSVSSVRKFFLVCSISAKTRGASAGVRRIVLLRSAPAKKVLLADARMMPLIKPLSRTTRPVAVVRSRCQSAHMVFTGEPGSSKVRVAMPSCSS